jgi:hypothetical protein
MCILILNVSRAWYDFQESLIEGDASSIWHVAKAIHKLEVFIFLSFMDIQSHVPEKSDMFMMHLFSVEAIYIVY